MSVIFSITESPDVGWLHVEINAATEISFDVEIPKGEYGEIFKHLCEFGYVASELDSQLMESADDAGRTKIDPELVKKCRQFAQRYRFKNVDCALPGFEEGF